MNFSDEDNCSPIGELSKEALFKCRGFSFNDLPAEELVCEGVLLFLLLD
jgi:hypothetical protein